MTENVLLQLTNSKGRIVYTAIQKERFIDVKHECGGGYCYKFTDLFLGCECSLMDNQSSKIGGKYSKEFIDYCIVSGYLPTRVIERIKLK